MPDSSDTLPLDLRNSGVREGEILGRQLGSYRVLSLLGEGGMGRVYLAEHVSIGRRAAIKVLHPEYAVRPGVVERFFNEARATNMVRHAGVIEVYDYGTEPEVGAYLVMELLEGEDLHARLRRRQRLDPEETVSIVGRVASAVGAVHARGIIHRDLKPDNIFVVPDEDHPTGERIKVLDFGIAKLIESGEIPVRKTRTGAVMGTPVYMAPEQCDGAKHVDLRADVYSLGVIAYECLCGRPPFVADGFGQLIALHIGAQPPPLRGFVPELPPLLEKVVLRALAKDPAARFPSMEVFARALKAALEGDERAPELAEPIQQLEPDGEIDARESAAASNQEIAWLPTVQERVRARPASTLSESVIHVDAEPEPPQRSVAVKAAAFGLAAALAAAAGWFIVGASAEEEPPPEPAPITSAAEPAALASMAARSHRAATSAVEVASPAPETAAASTSASTAPPLTARAEASPGKSPSRPRAAVVFSTAAVDKELAKVKRKLRTCAGPVEATRTVEFDVDAGGVPRKIVVRPDSFKSLENCIRGLVAKRRFPPPDSPPAKVTRTWTIPAKVKSGDEAEAYDPGVR